MKLVEGKAVSLKIKKGSNLCCEKGLLWATAAGQDILLAGGDSLTWRDRAAKLVIYPLSLNGAVCSLHHK